MKTQIRKTIQWNKYALWLTSWSDVLRMALSFFLVGSIAHWRLSHILYWPNPLVLLSAVLSLVAHSEWGYQHQYRANLLVTHKGIGICDTRQVRIGQSDFAERTRQAIDLVQKHDPRRFHRIQRHCKYIANKELVAGGAYDAKAKACDVDFSNLDFEHHPKWSLIRYASILVHEATHGLIDTRKIPYNNAMRLRIEHICRREERRFLNRFHPKAASVIASEPDEAWLRRYWNRKEYARMWKKRMQKARLSQPSQEGHVWKRVKGKARRLRGGRMSKE